MSQSETAPAHLCVYTCGSVQAILKGFSHVCLCVHLRQCVCVFCVIIDCVYTLNSTRAFNSVQLVVAMGFTLGTSTALLNQRAVARLTDQNRRSRARMSFPVVENGSWVRGVM